MNLEPIRALIATHKAVQETSRAMIGCGDDKYPDLAGKHLAASVLLSGATARSIPALTQLLEAVTWIKCSERMPEDCHRVMLCHPQADGYQWVLYGHWQGASDAWNVQGDSELHGRDFITHWMPLPNPPEDK